MQITMRSKAFANEGVRENYFQVDEDGTVRVYDKIAGYFTRCHSLSARDQDRIRVRAIEERRKGGHHETFFPKSWLYRVPL